MTRTGSPMKQTPSRDNSTTGLAGIRASSNIPTCLQPTGHTWRDRLRLLRTRQHRAATIQIGKGALEVLDLGQVESRDIGRAGMVNQIILMVVFRRIKPLERIYPGDDRTRKCVRLI